MSSLNLSYRLQQRFGWRTTAVADASRGIVRDLPHTSIPNGGLYDALDFLCDQPGIIRKRGGTSYQGTTVGATTTGVSSVFSPEFPAGLRVGAVGADGHLWDITTTTADIGALAATVDKPELFVDKVFYTLADGTTAPKKITNSGSALVIGTWGGSPPAGKYCAIHLSRPVIANNTANPNRIWFGPVPDPEATWDTTNSYVDTNHQITAIAATQGVLCVFSAGAFERLIGNVPPGIDGENMSLQPVGDNGCMDARSIARYGSHLIYAGQSGIWATDGSAPESLIQKSDGSGIQKFWYDSAPTSSQTTVAAEILKGKYYVISMHNPSWIETWVCYLPLKSWTRLSNVKFLCASRATVGADEMYVGTSSGNPGNKVLKLSGILSPAAANKNDADGTAVAPTLSTGGFAIGEGEHAYGNGHVTYDMVDAASDNPTLDVAVFVGVGDISASGITPSSVATLAETTTSTAVRKRFTVNKDADNIALKITQTHASAQTEIFMVTVEERPYILADEG